MTESTAPILGSDSRSGTATSHHEPCPYSDDRCPEGVDCANDQAVRAAIVPRHPDSRGDKSNTYLDVPLGPHWNVSDTKSFADAEPAEDLTEEFFGAESAGDCAELILRKSQFLSE